MRRIITVRTLAISTALILALGGIGGASAEDTSDTIEPPSVEASPPAEAPEKAADETSEEAADETSEEAANETSSSAEQPDTATSEAEEE